MILNPLLVILSVLSGLEAYKILVFYPTPSYSHQRAIISLTERLVKDGHQLFVISPNVVPGLEHHENYTFIDVSFSYKYFSEKEQTDENVNLQRQLSKWDIPVVFKPFADIARKQLVSDQYLQFEQRVRLEQISFDLIIVETFFLPFACAMSRLFPGSPPIISMSTLVVDFYAEEALGSPPHLSFVPAVFDGFTDRMTLWQKLENWFSHHYLMHKFRDGVEESVKKYLRETYGDGNETLADACWTNVSLAMLASNSMYFYPRAMGPNIIEVGPLHLKTPAPLPKHLQDWLDGAEKGVIYLSLGSNMKSKSLPVEVRANFLKFFKQLPSGYRVLWKWELDGAIPGQSDNILAQKWLPQDSVLAHPKVRVFITQGGLQSFQETVHYGVPTVGIPWFGDQECNVAKMVDAEIGVLLPPKELTSYEKIKSAIEAVLYDERYYKNMKRHSAISRDFTAQGMEKAVFWVEHVAKYGGASHLRPSTADASFFQYFCLDILSVILGLSSLLLFVVYSVCKLFISIIFQTPQKKKKTS
nr:PREDICTED: UDP-glucuronosyltransferase 1-9-like [Bemisia tabaci]